MKPKKMERKKRSERKVRGKKKKEERTGREGLPNLLFAAKP